MLGGVRGEMQLAWGTKPGSAIAQFTDWTTTDANMGSSGKLDRSPLDDSWSIQYNMGGRAFQVDHLQVDSDDYARLQYGGIREGRRTCDRAASFEQ